MTINVEQALGLAVQVSILAAAIAGFVVWLRRWIKSQVVEPVEKITHQVEPNGGKNQDTTRKVIESIQQGQAELIERIDALAEGQAFNRSLVNQALSIANQGLAIANATADRLDKHLERWGEAEQRAETK